jgi:hypothetical protein
MYQEDNLERLTGVSTTLSALSTNEVYLLRSVGFFTLPRSGSSTYASSQRFRNVLGMTDHLVGVMSSHECAASRRSLTFMTMMPASCSFFTTSTGGTPIAEIKSFAFSSITTSINSPSLPEPNVSSR